MARVRGRADGECENEGGGVNTRENAVRRARMVSARDLHASRSGRGSLRNCVCGREGCGVLMKRRLKL